MSGSTVLGEVLGAAIPFLIRAVTPLHPGSGSRISGLADLPVQREAGTDIPVIYGSSLKGALRSWAVAKGMTKIEEIFGPPPGRGDEGMGKAVFLDAKLLFLPVRSFKGIYGWITSPFLLRRFERDIKLVEELSKTKIGINDFTLDLSDPKEDEAFGTDGNLLKLTLDSGDAIILEDHVLRFVSREMKFLNIFKEIIDELRGRLVVVQHDNFKRLMRRAMEIIPHIEINKETGTVNNLWFQENLPVETMLYSVIFTTESLKGDVESLLEGFIHVGGDITTGLGFAKVYRF
ncbi:MAG: type III-B CRISPR module RAMP protein Cmr4 [Candidatus Korarchaeum sp.]